MAYDLPSFDRGTISTLLDSDNAKVVKRFIENFVVADVVESSEEPHFLFSDYNITLKLRDVPKGYEEKQVTLCEDGVATAYTFLVKEVAVSAGVSASLQATTSAILADTTQPTGTVAMATDTQNFYIYDSDVGWITFEP